MSPGYVPFVSQSPIGQPWMMILRAKDTVQDHHGKGLRHVVDLLRWLFRPFRAVLSVA